MIMQSPNINNQCCAGQEAWAPPASPLQLTSPKYYLYRIFYKPLIKDQMIYTSKGDFLKTNKMSKVFLYLPYPTCPKK